jgi:hypothetical protein
VQRHQQGSRLTKHAHPPNRHRLSGLFIRPRRRRRRERRQPERRWRLETWRRPWIHPLPAGELRALGCEWSGVERGAARDVALPVDPPATSR